MSCPKETAKACCSWSKATKGRRMSKGRTDAQLQVDTTWWRLMDSLTFITLTLTFASQLSLPLQTNNDVNPYLISHMCVTLYPANFPDSKWSWFWIEYMCYRQAVLGTMHFPGFSLWNNESAHLCFMDLMFPILMKAKSMSTQHIEFTIDSLQSLLLFSFTKVLGFSFVMTLN